MLVTLAQAQPQPQALPNTGQQITPLAPPGATMQTMNPGLADTPDWLASQAVTTAVNPAHDTLLVLTSGFNRVFKLEHPTIPALWSLNDSTEYVFIYDITKNPPALRQVIPIANTYNGITFSEGAFYVSGGSSDNIHVIINTQGSWVEARNSPIALGHVSGLGLNLTSNGPVPINSQVAVTPCAAGIAVSSDGNTMVVANYYNDSITVLNRGESAVDFVTWSKQTELDLRPGKSDPSKSGVPGGEYPFWVAIKGTTPNATAYVSSLRDREIDVVTLGRIPAVIARIPVKGQPNKMTLNAAQTLLYVAEDQSDTVDVIDTAQNTVIETIPVMASQLPSSLKQYKGANPNSVTLSPDEKQLYVTDGNLNSISVIALTGTNSGDHVIGLIPTGWYPNSVSFSGDGKTVYVVNSKTPTGPNPGWCYGIYGPPGSPNCNPSNQYNPQRTKAGLQTFARPDAAQLETLTAQVIANNRFTNTESDADAAIMSAVRKGVQHVIFIIKENRTYDQILGDLTTAAGKPLGNGEPNLTEFGASITPNLHNLARTFVTLDNFMDSAEVSYDGWAWTTAAQATEFVERQYPVAYGYRGLALDSEGVNRNVNVSIATAAERQKANPFTPSDPDVLAGTADVSAPDGPDNDLNTGRLWDSALRAGLSVRNYGFFIDCTRYNTPVFTIPLARNPFATGTIQSIPSNASLAPFTDVFFRGFDNAYPDFYRYKEWAREFDSSYAVGGLPALSLVRLMHDHTGNWVPGNGGYPPAAIDGVNTPDLQVADNDYAVGLLIEKIANSRYANNTLIFVVEDDAQDGGDHVDSHRSIAFVAGAYVKQGAVVSTPYNTINFVRTIEEVLGLPPMNLNDALARPMADIFNTTPSAWKFAAGPAPILYNTQLLLPPKPVGLVVPRPSHNAKYWGRVMKGMDFTDADRVDPGQFNRILWKGMMGNKPYPGAAKQEESDK